MARGLWVLSGVDYSNCASKNQCCKETCGMSIAVLVQDHQCICHFMEMYVCALLLKLYKYISSGLHKSETTLTIWD